MSELDDEEALFLSQARRGLNPSVSDRQRVLAQLLPQLALLPAATDGRSASRGTQSEFVASGLRRVGAIAFVSLGIGGGVGYLLGLHAGRDSQRPIAAAQSAVAVIPAPAPLLAPPPTPIAVAAPSDPGVPSEQRRTAAVRARMPTAPTTASTPALPAQPPGLDEEVRQLRRVERAIREGSPRLALVLLEDLDRVLPAGQLLEERRAASIMASCQLGADTAVADARAFTAQHAGSAYVARVIEICHLVPASPERILPAPGTDGAR